MPSPAATAPRPHRIVIVGGGAGGLSLAACLAEGRDARQGAIDVLLIDCARTHVWKPLLHEVAAGSLDSQSYEVDFMQQARRHHFRFHLGRLTDVDRATRAVRLAPLLDDQGQEIAPERTVGYDTLVLALGSVVNDFGIPGVREHALALNSATDAHRFHERLLAACTRAEFQGGTPVPMVVVGGGATGVELAAEVAEAVREIASYGRCLRQQERPVQLTIIESGARLVSPLPEKASSRVLDDLRERGVEVRLGQQVAEVRHGEVVLKSGERVPSVLTVWAAGIQGPAVAAALGGLDVSGSRQLLVHRNLQCVHDDNVFAFGDCARVASGPPVPPTAQAAQQQAHFLAHHLPRRLQGLVVPDFSYHERGVLVSLGRRDAVGSFIGQITGKRFLLEGLLARMSYAALHRRHLATLLGWMPAMLSAVGIWLAGRSQPRVKLH